MNQQNYQRAKDICLLLLITGVLFSIVAIDNGLLALFSKFIICLLAAKKLIG